MTIGKKIKLKAYGEILEFTCIGEKNFYDENTRHYGPVPLFVNRDYEKDSILIKALELREGPYEMWIEHMKDTKEKTPSSNKLEKEIFIPF